MSIDTPEAPTCDRGTYREKKRAETLALRDDLQWMADHGENLEGAAKRIDKSVDALEAWCRNHDFMPLFRHLQANAPLLGRKSQR